MVEIKGNFQPDTPTLNGRIYPKGVLDKAFEGLGTRDILLYDSYQPEPDLSKAVGKLVEYRGNNFEFIIELFDTERKESFEKMISEGLVQVTTAGYGRVNENNEIEDYKLLHTYLTGDTI